MVVLLQPRILMAMARDGLLPSFFSDVNKKSQVPVKSTVTTGLVAALLAFFMDVFQLARMVSVGALLAFTVVAVSLLSSLQDSIDAFLLRYSDCKLLLKHVAEGNYTISAVKRRKNTCGTIMFTGVGVLLLTSATSYVRFSCLITSATSYMLTSAHIVCHGWLSSPI